MKRHTIISTCIMALLTIASCKRPPLPPPVVLFDQGHGQTSSIQENGPSDISKLKELFREQGFVVRSNSAPFGKDSFKDAAAVIVSGPVSPLTGSEIQAIGTYLNEGGQMCFMLKNATSLTSLFANLQVAVANGLVHEQENVIGGVDIFFTVTNLPKHPLTKDLKRFNMYGAWPLNTALEANVIAKTSKKSWVDLNGDNLLSKQDAMQSFPVLITGQLGHGHFVIFGDDELLQNQYLRGENETLGKNLARWFKEGSYY